MLLDSVVGEGEGRDEEEEFLSNVSKPRLQESQFHNICPSVVKINYEMAAVACQDQQDLDDLRQIFAAICDKNMESASHTMSKSRADTVRRKQGKVVSILKKNSYHLFQN